MWKTVKALLLGVGLLLALPCGPVLAQVATKTIPISSTSWTQVGTGPLFLSTIGKTFYTISPTTPTFGNEGFPTPPNGVPVQANQIVWVRLADNDSFNAAAFVYPISQGTISLGTLTAWGTAPPGGTQVANFNVNCLVGCSASTVPSFTPTGNSLATPLTPAAGAVSSVALPAGGTAELISNTGTTLAYVRLTIGAGTANANDIPIQPGAGCVAGTGTATFINVFNPVIGASINVSSGTGLGSCPTGGGGGVASGGTGGLVTLGDGTTSPVAVKPASTAPAATDKALVVALSPNGAQATGAKQDTAQTSLTAIAGSTASTATNTGTTATNTGTTATNTANIDTDMKSGAQKAQPYDGVNTIFTVAHPGIVSCPDGTCGGGGSGGGASSGATPQTTDGMAIDIAASGGTQLVLGTALNYIYVTAYDFVASGTTNISLVAYSGASCTGTATPLWGPVHLTAQAGEARGAGLGGILKPAPVGTNLCFVNSAAVQVGGSLTYTKSPSAPSQFGGGGGGGGASVAGIGSDAATSSNMAGFIDINGKQAGVGESTPMPVKMQNPAVNTYGQVTTSGVSCGANGPAGLDPCVRTRKTLPISVNSIGTLVLIPASGSLSTYVTHWDAAAGGTGTFQLVSGTRAQSITASATTGGVLTVTAAPTTGVNNLLFVGEPITGTNIPANDTIASFISGTGGTGTYQLAINPSVAAVSQTMTVTSGPCNVAQALYTGAYDWDRHDGMSKGDGGAPIFIAPPTHDVCTITTTAVNMRGSIGHVQF